jgi:solute carrier family 25, member 38
VNAGGVSRALATAMLCPLSVIKTQMEATGAYSAKDRHNMVVVASNIAQKHGVCGLWKGVLPTILSNAPFSAIYYSIYQEIRSTASSPDRPQMAVNMGAALVAAMIATIATQPTDVMRTRVQLGVNKNTVESVASLSKYGGRAFMSGAMPRFLKRSIQTALVWTIYEELYPRISRLSAARRA